MPTKIWTKSEVEELGWDLGQLRFGRRKYVALEGTHLGLPLASGALHGTFRQDFLHGLADGHLE